MILFVTTTITIISLLLGMAILNTNEVYNLDNEKQKIYELQDDITVLKIISDLNTQQPSTNNEIIDITSQLQEINIDNEHIENWSAYKTINIHTNKFVNVFISNNTTDNDPNINHLNPNVAILNETSSSAVANNGETITLNQEIINLYNSGSRYIVWFHI